jgi:hypothetical protein
VVVIVVYRWIYKILCNQCQKVCNTTQNCAISTRRYATLQQTVQSVPKGIQHYTKLCNQYQKVCNTTKNCAISAKRYATLHKTVQSVPEGMQHYKKLCNQCQKVCNTICSTSFVLFIFAKLCSNFFTRE